MPKYILNGQLDIEPLINARKFLKKALQEAETELEIAGAIKAFEVCHELAWKFCQKILRLRYIDVFSPKETFRVSEIQTLDCVDYVRVEFTYIADYPTGDPRDLDKEP